MQSQTKDEGIAVATMYDRSLGVSLSYAWERRLLDDSGTFFFLSSSTVFAASARVFSSATLLDSVQSRRV